MSALTGATITASESGGDVVVRVLSNATAERTAVVEIAGQTSVVVANATVLAAEGGDLTAFNTPAIPNAVAPRVLDVVVAPDKRSVSIAMPAHSYAAVRLRVQ